MAHSEQFKMASKRSVHAIAGVVSPGSQQVNMMSINLKRRIDLRPISRFLASKRRL